jgi:hypothetical protein
MQDRKIGAFVIRLRDRRQVPRRGGGVVWGSILGISRDDVTRIVEPSLGAKFLDLTGSCVGARPSTDQGC